MDPVPFPSRPMSVGLPVLGPGLARAQSQYGRIARAPPGPSLSGADACRFSFKSTVMVVGATLTLLGALKAFMAESGFAGVLTGMVINAVIWGGIVNLVISGIYSMVCRSAPAVGTWVLAGLIIAAALGIFLWPSGQPEAAQPADPNATGTTDATTGAATGTTAKADTYASDSAGMTNYVPVRQVPRRTHGVKVDAFDA